MEPVTVLGPGESRVRIPVKRLLARPFIPPNLTAQITRGVQHHPCDSGFPTSESAPARTKERIAIVFFS
jgi:hypothetical protein